MVLEVSVFTSHAVTSLLPLALTPAHVSSRVRNTLALALSLLEDIRGRRRWAPLPTHVLAVLDYLDGDARGRHLGKEEGRKR